MRRRCIARPGAQAPPLQRDRPPRPPAAPASPSVNNSTLPLISTRARARQTDFDDDSLPPLSPSLPQRRSRRAAAARLHLGARLSAVFAAPARCAAPPPARAGHMATVGLPILPAAGCCARRSRCCCRCSGPTSSTPRPSAAPTTTACTCAPTSWSTGSPCTCACGKARWAGARQHPHPPRLSNRLRLFPLTPLLIPSAWQISSNCPGYGVATDVYFPRYGWVDGIVGCRTAHHVRLSFHIVCKIPCRWRVLCSELLQVCRRIC